jgi:hypothetical protein
MDTTVNAILREWRDLWPGGLEAEQYSTLNLMAQCRQGTLGYNRARCEKCHHVEWYASSCGDRHCPNCLGPRQASWSSQVCERLPDCAHFHLVFTLPAQIHEFFKLNYRRCGDVLFSAMAETLKQFLRNNSRLEGGFMAVLHTWGRSLNWHPHLHVLAGAGGMDLDTGGWRGERPDYLFNVFAMSKVFRAIFLRELEAIDSDPGVKWPERLDTLEARRSWRVDLAGRNWNIFVRPTLHNTRAVVRYLARYTSRIALSNSRITRVDPAARTVTFTWKDYRHGGRNREMTLAGGTFLRRFTDHLVPKGFRRIRYFGLLAGAGSRIAGLEDAPQETIGEKAPCQTRPECPRCGGSEWTYQPHCETHAMIVDEDLRTPVIFHSGSTGYRFSLFLPAAPPESRPADPPAGAGARPPTPRCPPRREFSRPTSG